MKSQAPGKFWLVEVRTADDGIHVVITQVYNTPLLQENESRYKTMLLWYICFRVAKRQIDLSGISDKALYAEMGKRRSAARTSFSGGRAPTCECGKCRKCLKREAMRKYRAK